MKRIVGFLLCVALLLSLCGCNSQDYKKAAALYQDGDFSSAKVIFDELGDYEDAAAMSKDCSYNMAIELLNDGAYSEAYALFAELGNYKDSAEYAAQAKWGMLYQYIEENGTYHEDLEHKVLSITVEDDSEDGQEHIAYIFADDPYNIVIGYRNHVEDSQFLILRNFSINLERGKNESAWTCSFGTSILGGYRLDVGTGSVCIDTCTTNTSLEAETYFCEIKDPYGKESTTTDRTNKGFILFESTVSMGLEEVLTYVPKILKSTGLPIEMKDLGFMVVK